VSVITLRPTANGTVNSWTPKGTKEAWQELGQEAVEPAEPLTTRGIVSPAEVNKGQSIHFTWPTLLPGQKIVNLIVHFNGNWAAKMRVNASDSTPAGIEEAELEALATGVKLHWANAETNWTKIKGSGSTFPWMPWTQAQLEKAKGSQEPGYENFQLTFITGKAATIELYEVYVVVTVEGEGGTTFTDSRTATVRPVVTLTEALAYSDVCSAAGHPSGTDVEALSFADTTTATAHPSATVTEAFSSGAEDRPVTVMSLHATATETLTGVDAPSSRLRPAPSSTDVGAFSDAPRSSLHATATANAIHGYVDTPVGRLRPTSNVAEISIHADVVTATLRLAPSVVESETSPKRTLVVYTVVDLPRPLPLAVDRSRPLPLAVHQPAPIPLTTQIEYS